MNDEMMKWLQSYDEASRNYAGAKAQADYLDNMKSVLLSQMMSKYPELAVNRAEIAAKASSEYVIHLEGLQVAEERKNFYYSRCELARMHFDRLRSVMSYEKNMIKNTL